MQTTRVVAEPWELVYSTSHEYMEKTPVEGGFLYRNWVQTGTDSLVQHVLMAFVPTDALDSAAEAPVIIDVPHVSGGNVEGDVLTCTMGNWENVPTSYSYQWQRGGVTVGEDANTYTLGPDDVGGSITCTVTASNDAGSTVAPPSNAIEIS